MSQLEECIRRGDAALMALTRQSVRRQHSLRAISDRADITSLLDEVNHVCSASTDVTL